MDAAAAAAAAAAEFKWTVGPILLGVFFNTFLFGISTYQFILYYYRKFKDPFWIQAFVAALLVVDVGHSCIIIYIAWFYCNENFTHPEMLAYPLWAFLLTPTGEVIAATIVQLFLGVRLYTLTRNVFAYGVVLTLTLASFSAGLVVGVKAFSLVNLMEAIKLKDASVTWLVFQAAADIAISLSLSYTLYKSRTGIRQTDWALNKLLRKALQTGIPASVFAILTLAAYVQFGTKTSNLYACFSVPLGRIYTMTIMDTLNVRKELREAMATPMDASEILAEMPARSRPEHVALDRMPSAPSHEGSASYNDQKNQTVSSGSVIFAKSGYDHSADAV